MPGLPPYLTNDDVAEIVRRALAEDVRSGDVTTLATVAPEATATAELIAKEAASTDADERSSSLARFTQAIQAHKGDATRGLQAQGNVSDAYKQAGSDAALGITDYGGKIAGLLSSMDAPIQQRQNDALVRGRYATDIDQIRRFSDGDDYLARLRLRGIRPNPWVSAIGAMAGAYGSNYSGGGTKSQ